MNGRTLRRIVALPLLALLLATVAHAKSMELTSANTYYGQGEKAKALEWYEKADQKNTQEAQVYARLVELYAEKKEWAKMNAAFAKIDDCTDKPKKLEKFRTEAQVVIDELWMGLWNGSLEHFTAAEEAVAAGDSTLALTEYDQARDRIALAIQILPAKVELQKRLADISISQFNRMYRSPAGYPILLQAVEPYSRLVEQNPDSLDYGLTLVQVQLNAKRFEDASRTVGKLLETHPDDPALLDYAGKALIQQGLALGGEEGDARMKEAVGYMRRAIELNPDDPRLIYNLGLLYRDMQEFDQALQTFGRLGHVADAPKELQLDTWISMAMIYLQDLPEEQQDAFKAAECFQEALDLDPENAELKNNLGVALLRTGDPDSIERGKKLLGY